jgi:glycosyltransferase involved in cell wall biosynthesis
MNETADISVVISTYNRADRLPDALERLLSQRGVNYEVVAVDNNSTDGTRTVIESYAARSGGRLRYVFEGKQGVSYGRNAGVAATHAPLIAFTDDDMRMAEDWLAKIKQTFDAHPELDCVGGKVLPLWLAPCPAWLTPRHWSPIALLDYGTEPVLLDTMRRQTLVTANFAVRRAAFDRVGGFSPLTQRTTNDVCSTEDNELQLRLWRTGVRGMYFPDIIGWAQAPPRRLTKDYHRRWHRRHGRCMALMRDEQFEASEAGRLFDIPAHLFRQTAGDIGKWAGAWLRKDEPEAFWRETRLWFFLGFIGQRYRDYRAAEAGGVIHEITSFARSMMARTVKGRA